ncbi:hypothetical protein BH09MYX1_BH09MYX1_10380 [soil metagenome]
MRPIALLLLPLCLLAFFGIAGVGCDGCGSQATPAQEAAAPLAAVPLPTGVLAEAVLPTPDATWRTVQGTVGGMLSFLAPTFSGLLGATAGAPGLSGLVETDSPAYVVLGEGQGLHYAVALRANEAAATSWAGSDAGSSGFGSGFAHASGTEAEMKVFEPNTPDGPWIGVPSGNFVVVATSHDDLVRLGPYAFRTLPQAPLPKDPALFHVSHDGVQRLGALAAARWTDEKGELLAKDEEQRKAHGGRAPDHGDPRALVAAVDRWVGSWLDAGRDMTSADVSLVPLEGTDRALALALVLAPPAAGPARALVDAMRPGEMHALEGAPDGVLLAIESRSDAAERARTATDLAKDAEDVFRLSPADRDALALDLGAWADARTDEVVFGFGVAPARSLFVRATVKDEAAGGKAFASLVRRADAPSIHDVWRNALDVTNVHTAPRSAPGVGAGTLVTLDRKPGASPILPQKLGLFYTAQRGELVAAGAEDAPSALSAMLGGGKRLGDDVHVREALARVRGRGAFVVVARPLLVAAAPRSDTAIFAAGRDGDRAMLRLEATGTLLRELVRLLQTD